MFGFNLPENFNYPYSSQSITEFWRRWHMSLSRWFRDYLYLPLGGNRKGKGRTYFNLLVVFFLCGLWHGASWTFVVWGLFHGCFLVMERLGGAALLSALWRPARHFYAMAVVCVGWVLFRADTFGFAMHYLAAMFGFGHGGDTVYHLGGYFTPEVSVALAVGVVGSTPFVPFLRKTIEKLRKATAFGERAWGAYAIAGFEVMLLAGILMLSTMSLASQTHNPFIYFRF
jgi:alginate O-acetyltransferase complex protein AlgI